MVACTQPVERDKPSTLRVRVDADQVVRQDTVRVVIEVEVESAPGSGWEPLDERSYRAEPTPIEWPLTFELSAEEASQKYRYNVVAHAQDAQEAVVARAQAIRTPEQALESGLRLHFETACFRQASLCPEGLSCAGGICVNARDDQPVVTPQDAVSDRGGEVSPAGESAQALAMAGDACPSPGRVACPEHAAQSTLICEDGMWRTGNTCAAHERCDSAGGAAQGTCRPIARECANQQPNVPFCAAGTMLVCEDLVSTKVRPCREHELCVLGDNDTAECGCEAGFAKDNGICREATDCAAGAGGCDSLTRCSMIAGKPTCGPCPDGYTGSGEKGCAPLLLALQVSEGELESEVTQTGRAYSIHVPFVAPRVRLTAMAPPDTRAAFNSTQVLAGEAWTSPLLPFGSEHISLVLTSKSGNSTTYDITLEREGAQEAHFKAAQGPVAGDYYGYSVALSDDLLMVGVPYDDGPPPGKSTGATDSGAAYLYTRGDSGWRQSGLLKGSDAAPYDYFGAISALDGDTLAIGAPRSSDDTSTDNPRPGALYVFTRKNGTWSEQARLESSHGHADDKFGFGVALFGDTLAIGASSSTAPGETERQGAVYIYERAGEKWTERQILSPAGMCPGCSFGHALALHGDYLAVGSGGAGDGDLGPSVFVYHKRGGVWTQQQRIREEPAVSLSTFGFSVALHGDRLAIGAPYLPPAALAAAVTPAGTVTVFDRVGDVWQKTAVLTADDAAQSDHFGVSIALSASTLAIGANGETSGATGLNGDARRSDGLFSGAAYLFARSDDGKWKQSDYIKPANNRSNASFGWVVALSKDSLAVGAPAEDSGNSGINGPPGARSSLSGAAYVFR